MGVDVSETVAKNRCSLAHPHRHYHHPSGLCIKSDRLLGFGLLLGGLLGAFTFEGLPDIMIATSVISIPIGFILLLLGSEDMNRQFKLVKRYISSRAQSGSS